MNNNTNNLPKTAPADRIPLWIKVMWVCGVFWVIGYIAIGLINGPQF